jgi:hypothetical protein
MTHAVYEQQVVRYQAHKSRGYENAQRTLSCTLSVFIDILYKRCVEYSLDNHLKYYTRNFSGETRSS